MSPDWTINSITLKTVCKNQFVVDGSMAVVQSCYVSSGLESWFEIIHVKPPNIKSQSWAVKKKHLPSHYTGWSTIMFINLWTELTWPITDLNQRSNIFLETYFQSQKEKRSCQTEGSPILTKIKFSSPSKEKTSTKNYLPFLPTKQKVQTQKSTGHPATLPFLGGGGSIPLV